MAVTSITAYSIIEPPIYPPNGRAGEYRNPFGNGKDIGDPGFFVTGPACARGFTLNDCVLSADGGNGGELAPPDPGAGGGIGGGTGGGVPSAPVCTEVTYTIVTGDTLTSIAAAHPSQGVDWKQICDANVLADCDSLAVGAVLTIPCDDATLGNGIRGGGGGGGGSGAGVGLAVAAVVICGGIFFYFVVRPRLQGVGAGQLQSGGAQAAKQAALPATRQVDSAPHVVAVERSLQPGGSLPSGWSAAIDPASKCTYYIHTSGKTQWELPTAVGAAAGADHGAAASHASATRASRPSARGSKAFDQDSHQRLSSSHI